MNDLRDFLGVGEEDVDKKLWKAMPPVEAFAQDNAVILRIPFEALLNEEVMNPDPEEAVAYHDLRVMAYGNNILRCSMDFGGGIMDDSPMLQMDPTLTITPLSIEKKADAWLIKDDKDNIRMKIDFKEIPLKKWSDLQPPSRPQPVISFYPNAKKAIELSAYDQFFPGKYYSLGLAFLQNKNQTEKVIFSTHAQADEVFMGAGERFGKADHSGKTYRLINQDGQGVNSRRTYKNIPFYLSNEGYGVFVHSSDYMDISFADYSTRAVQIAAEQSSLDLFLIGGASLEEITFGYRQLTGFPAMPQLWSFGAWMSKMSYFSAEEIRDVCQRLRQEDFPCDVIHIDTGWFKTDWLCEWTFSPERFPDPKAFIKDLKENGFRVSLWQMPYIAQKALQYEEAAANDYIGQAEEGRQQGGSNFSALDYAGSIDFTKTSATAWYKNLLKPLLEMGVACIKADFGEDIHLDAAYDQMAPESLHNLYGLLYQKAVFDITKKVSGEGIIWARTAWAGCQRYPVHWGGDAAANWDGLAGSLKGGLHLGLSGFGFWSHDVPGFYGQPDFMNTVIPDELYVRWTQFGVFSSHLRYHGTSEREPYAFPEVADMVRKWLKLRYALIPYLLEQSKRVTTSGYPIIRALAFHHLEDKTCLHIDDQYYFGDSFLVAPVMNAENKRSVYLPEGKWANFFTGEIMEGKKWLNAQTYPLEQMPLWIKYGAKIPYYPLAVNCTDDMDLEKIEHIAFDEKFPGLANTKLGRLCGF